MAGEEKGQMKKRIVGIIGASECDAELRKIAQDVGSRIAGRGWILLCGGLGGVMEAASMGAQGSGGTVVGILPTASTADANPYVDIPIATNMGHARNIIIAHTADVLVAIGGGYGTLSEISIAKKLGKRVYGLRSWSIKGIEQKKDVDELFASLGES